MSPGPAPPQLDPEVRERAMRRALYQGVIGTLGGWLMGGITLNYFAMELGAKGFWLGVVLAVGNIVSALRIVAPYFVNRSNNRKRVWLVAMIAARLLAIGLPLLAFPQFRPPGIEPLALLVLLLCGTTIAAAIGDVSWLSWYADIVPEGRWGRYFAYRNMLNAVPAITVQILGGLAVDAYGRAYPESRLTAYAVLFGLGVLCHLGSLLPLLTVPNVPLRERPAHPPPLWREVTAPFRDPNFRRYAYFWCWLMLGSGISQTAFNLYQKNYLLLGLLAANFFQVVNQVFNMAGQRWAGAATDRFGNKPIIILGLIGAATGPFFWLPTSPGNYAWMYAAYVVWGFGWAGVHLGCQNLMLKIAPRGNNVAYIAAVQGLGGICLSVSIILGGIWLDALMAAGWRVTLPFGTFNAYHLFFLLSFLGRSSAALWVFRIREPRARSITQMVRVVRRARRRRRTRLAPAGAARALATTPSRKAPLP